VAAGGDLVELDALCGADQGGIAGLAVTAGPGDLAALLEQTLHAVAALGLGLQADAVEDLLQPGHVLASLVEV